MQSYAALAHYVNDSNESVYAQGRGEQDLLDGRLIALSYMRDVKTVEQSRLGSLMRSMGAAAGYEAEPILAAGVEDLEKVIAGAIQVTRFYPEGVTFARDHENYLSKLESMAKLHGTDVNTMHAFATIHEYAHGLGIMDERENHEFVKSALEAAIEQDPQNHVYRELLRVQEGEIENRYAKKPIKTILNYLRPQRRAA